MTTLEKIEAWIIPNISRLISAAKLREILIEMLEASESQYKAETYTATFGLGVTEVTFGHGLNSADIDVHIFASSGEKINPMNYRVIVEGADSVRVVKDLEAAAWTSAKVIISKIF